MMSHVDDGTLHTYLDGALDEYPSAEAERVREHLDVCGECRSRLEAERAVRDQAASILSGAVPRVDVPTLEELRSYVRAKSPASTGRSRVQRLGWAASVVLALGTGWLLRGGRVDPSARAGDVSVPSGRAVAAEDASGSSEPVGASATEDAVEVGGEPGAGQAPAPVRLGEQVMLPSRTPLPTLDVDGRLGAQSSPDVVVEVESAPPPLPPAPRLEDTIGPRVMTPEILVQANDSGRDRGSSSETRPVAGGVVSSANVSAPATGIDGLGPTIQLDELTDPRHDDIPEEESYSLVVPGLEVLDVRFRGSGVRPEGQVALQRLESGDTLTVIHLPGEIELSSLDVPTNEQRQIVIQTASGWIVMRAPVSEDELLDLMRRLLSAD